LEKTGRLPKETIIATEKIVLPPETYSEVTYNRLAVEGKLPMSEYYNPKGNIVYLTNVETGKVTRLDTTRMQEFIPQIKALKAEVDAGAKFTRFSYSRRLPTYAEWKGDIIRIIPERPVTKVRTLTPSEYEVYKIIKGKHDLRHPLTNELITPESASRYYVEAVEGAARQHGFKVASEMYGKKLVKTIFPDAPRYIKAETRWAEMMLPERTAQRRAIAEKVTRFIYDNSCRI